MMYPSMYSTHFRRNSIDQYMGRVKALKREPEISLKEVRQLIADLDRDLASYRVSYKNRKMPGSRYTASEVSATVATLRSLLLATEVVRKALEEPDIPDVIQRRARANLLNVISRL